jgi:chromosome segregation ATPase
MFKAYLREQNDALITEFASHRTSTGDSVMTQQQQQIFRDTNEQSTDLPVLVRLYQRLRVLVDNAAAIAEERESRGAVIEAHHTEAEAAVRPRRTELEAQHDALGDEIAQLARDEEALAPTIAMYSEHTEELHAVLAERRALRGERQGYRDERRALPRADRRVFDHYYGPRLAQIEARLAELAPLIERLSDEEHDTRSDRREATQAARQIAARIRQAEDRRARLERSIDALEGDSGYHTAHGGVGRTDFNGTDERRTVTGRLRDLVPEPNWSAFLRADGPAVEDSHRIESTLR